jgi:hypothetical protein
MFSSLYLNIIGIYVPLSVKQARWGDAINKASCLPSLASALDVRRSDLLMEVIELQDWVFTINVLDSALESVLRYHPSLILLWDKGGPPKPRLVPPDFMFLANAIAQVATNLFPFIIIFN